MQNWVELETQSANFGDVRLDRRFGVLLKQLGAKPSLSIPAACGGKKETGAAYRFFDNKRVTPQKVLRPHIDSTLNRIRKQKVVLVPQDTTEIDLTRKQEKVGGPLSDEKRRGMFAHPLLALTPERVPLGVVQAKIWSRDEESLARHQAERTRKRKQLPIEAKESCRWLEGYRAVCVVAAAAPATQVIALSDSEGDIYECLAEPQQQTGPKAEFIVRACQDRALIQEADDEEKTKNNLWQHLSGRSALGKLTVHVSKRRASTGDGRSRRQARQQARKAKVTVRSTQVSLRPPYRKGVKLPVVMVNAILVQEENPPVGEAPIEWLLLTSLPVETFVQACQVIDYYCVRWEIEVYFRTLKSGCQIEKLQLEKDSRIEAALALYLIVAWRVLYVLMLGRECPELPCDKVLSKEEWQSVYVIMTNQSVPAQVPNLATMVRMIAELGGWLGRKHDGPPGPKVMWIGLQRVRDYAIAWNRFGPGVRINV